MPDGMWPIFVILVFLFFAGLALILLVWPSLFLRRIRNPLLPDTPWNRVQTRGIGLILCLFVLLVLSGGAPGSELQDRKSTRLNSSHGYISYAVFCLKKKKKTTT